MAAKSRESVATPNLEPAAAALSTAAKAAVVVEVEVVVAMQGVNHACGFVDGGVVDSRHNLSFVETNSGAVASPCKLIKGRPDSVSRGGGAFRGTADHDDGDSRRLNQRGQKWQR